MKTAAEEIPARYVSTNNRKTPEPAFRRSWSQLRKLRWKASLIMSENPGVLLYVMKGRSWSNNIFNYGLFQISFNNGGMSAMDYYSAWELLNGIDLGLDLSRNAAPDLIAAARERDELQAQLAQSDRAFSKLTDSHAKQDAEFVSMKSGLEKAFALYLARCEETITEFTEGEELFLADLSEALRAALTTPTKEQKA